MTYLRQVQNYFLPKLNANRCCGNCHIHHISLKLYFSYFPMFGEDAMKPIDKSYLNINFAEWVAIVKILQFVTVSGDFSS